MQLTARELCDLLQGQLQGNPETIITHPAKIEEAGEGAVSFIANPKYIEYASSTKASVLIVNTDAEINNNSLTLIRVQEAYSAFTQVLKRFSSEDFNKTGIDKQCYISSSAKIGKNVYVGALAYIGDNVTVKDNAKIFPQTYIGDESAIGEGTVLYAGVRLYRKTVIGKNCIIHSGVVIGSDGFGFAPLPDGSYMKVPQLGNVIIEDNVEIGSNTTIDRATMGSTIIRKGVKLDNQIQVAHNVEIGENTVIAAQTGVSGSTRLGKNCVIGGQVGFVGHIVIADGTKVNAQSGVSKSINEKGKAWNGAPAFEYRDSLKSQVVFRNLPELEKRVEALEEKSNSNKK